MTWSKDAIRFSVGLSFNFWQREQIRPKLTDLQVNQVLSGAVPFFDIVNGFFFCHNGLALLVPKNEKNLIITKSVK